MVFWQIQKKIAEEDLKRERSCVQVYQGGNGPSKLGKRNRKRKSYEKEFEDDDVVKKYMTKVKMVLIQFFVSMF